MSIVSCRLHTVTVFFGKGPMTALSPFLKKAQLEQDLKKGPMALLSINYKNDDTG